MALLTGDRKEYIYYVHISISSIPVMISDHEFLPRFSVSFNSSIFSLYKSYKGSLRDEVKRKAYWKIFTDA